MRVVFMGTPDFAVPSLRALHASTHEVACAYTQPDRPRGRGRAPRPSPVKQVATELQVPVRQPGSLKDSIETAALAEIAPDALCVAAYGLILPGEVLQVPSLGSLNVHASLLPRHRGAAPVHRAILEGDGITGVSIMSVQEGVDTGPVAATAEVDVAGKDVAALTDELAELGARLLVNVLDDLEAGTVTWTAQDDSLATYAEKIGPEELRLDPGLTVTDALRRVRASSAHASARAVVAGTRLAVEEALRSEEGVPAGSARLLKEGPHLGLADGAVLLTRIRPENRSSMTGEAFVCGADELRGDSGLRWGADS